MEGTFKNLLLLALPASGKSEVRKFLTSLDQETRQRDLHMGSQVQLDDFPYVHLMRCIDDELARQGRPNLFFQAPDKPFLEGLTWGVLIHLLNEDFDDLAARRPVPLEDAAQRMLRRIDAARAKVDAPPLFYQGGSPLLPAEAQAALLKAIEAESRKIISDRLAEYPDTLEGKTVVIEFARGGADTATPPLPFGYEYSLKQLSPAILKDAALFYVWVTPEESRRKNFERADPNDPGSILAHGVPIEVMLKDYGCDDLEYLLETSERPGYITVKHPQGTFHLPTAKFDNRVDKTSFIRGANWDPEHLKALHQGMAGTAQALYKKYQER